MGGVDVEELVVSAALLQQGPVLQELGQEGAGPQPGQLRGGRVQGEGQQAQPGELTLGPFWQGLVVDGLYQEGVVQVIHHDNAVYLPATVEGEVVEEVGVVGPQFLLPCPQSPQSSAGQPGGRLHRHSAPCFVPQAWCVQGSRPAPFVKAC